MVERSRVGEKRERVTIHDRLGMVERCHSSFTSKRDVKITWKLLSLRPPVSPRYQAQPRLGPFPCSASCPAGTWLHQVLPKEFFSTLLDHTRVVSGMIPPKLRPDCTLSHTTYSQIQADLNTTCTDLQWPLRGPSCSVCSLRNVLMLPEAPSSVSLFAVPVPKRLGHMTGR